jgi:hypothetical protein
MSELSEIIIDLRENSDILNCIIVDKLYIKKILKRLNYDKIIIITDYEIKIEDDRVIIIKENEIEKLLNKKIIKINKNKKLITIFSNLLFVLIIIFLITNENILIFFIIIILILMRDNLKKIINIFYKKKVII